MWGGALISLYASPVQALALDVAVSAYIFTVHRATPPLIYSIASGILPTGLTLNASTGVISGTPTVQQVTLAVFRIVDHSGRTAVTSTIQFIVTAGGAGNYLITENGVVITTETGQPIQVTT